MPLARLSLTSLLSVCVGVRALLGQPTKRVLEARWVEMQAHPDTANAIQVTHSSSPPDPNAPSAVRKRCCGVGKQMIKVQCRHAGQRGRKA
eukprot:3084800-Rhodomonas_salina.1